MDLSKVNCKKSWNRKAVVGDIVYVSKRAMNWFLDEKTNKFKLLSDESKGLVQFQNCHSGRTYLKFIVKELLLLKGSEITNSSIL